MKLFFSILKINLLACFPMLKHLPDLSDLIAIAGIGMVTYGAFSIYEPVGWIVIGAGLLSIARKMMEAQASRRK